jgi:hypothetical protein
MRARLLGGGEFELCQLRIAAEAAIGFAPRCVGQRCFCSEARVCEGVEPALIRLAASDDAEAFADRGNVEQPEAREYSRKSGKIAQQPRRTAAFALHAGDSTAAYSPPIWRQCFPQIFGGSH